MCSSAFSVFKAVFRVYYPGVKGRSSGLSGGKLGGDWVYCKMCSIRVCQGLFL